MCLAYASSLESAVQFELRRPDVIRSVGQRCLLGWWNRLRAAARLPLQAALDTEDLADYAPDMMFCDVVRAAGRARLKVRVVGTRLGAAYGRTWLGGFLDEVMPEHLRPSVAVSYGKVVETGQPLYSIIETCDRGGHPVTYERLLLPFSRDGAGVDRVVTSVEMISVDGAFESRNLMIKKNAPPVFRIQAVIDVPDTPVGPLRSDDDVVEPAD